MIAKAFQEFGDGVAWAMAFAAGLRWRKGDEGASFIAGSASTSQWVLTGVSYPSDKEKTVMSTPAGDRGMPPAPGGMPSPISGSPDDCSRAARH